MLILLLAAAVRITNAAHFPVWTDEGWSAWAVSDPAPGAILAKVASDRHPPLYFLALGGWQSVAGDSRIALRFLSIAGGLLTVAAAYRLGADGLGRGAAAYGALLIGLLPAAVYYSQEIRHYGWLMLSVTLMTLFFVRYVRRPHRGALIGYALSTTAMLYTLYFGVLVLLAQLAVGLIVWRGAARHKRNLIAAWLAALLLYVPWLTVLVKQWSILSSGLASLPTTPAGILASVQIVFSDQFGLTGALYALGAWTLFRRGRVVSWTFLLSGGGLLLVMIGANVRIGLLSARTLVFLTPPLMLVCGVGLMQVAPPAVRRLLIGALAIGLVAAPGTLQPRLDYPAAARAVAADYAPGDTVLLETGWDDNAFRYELLRALGAAAAPSIIRTLPWVDNRDPNEPVLPHIEPLLRDQRRVWIVGWLQPSQVGPFLDAGGDGFRRVLSRETPIGAQYAGQYADPVVHVALYERPQPAPDSAAFGGLFRLNGYLIPDQAAPGQTVHVDLWWTALQAPPRDYSVGVYWMASSGYVALHSDAAPGDVPTSRWLPGALMFDRHTFSLPADLPPDRYRVGVTVYWYADQKRLTLPDASDAALIGSVHVG